MSRIKSQPGKAPNDFVWLVASTYGRDLWGKKLIVALSGYFDGSGSHGMEEFVLAGYVMSVEKWIAFNEDWTKELHRAPSIGYFHSVDAERGEGEFSLILREVRKRKVNDLASIIEKHEPMALYTALHWNDYKAVFAGNVPPEIDNPFYILFFGILQRVVDYQKAFHFYERVDFTFDAENKPIQEVIQRLYPIVRSQCSPDIRNILGEQPIFRDDKEARPLQAADLYAWQIRRSHTHPDEPRPVLPRISSESGTAKYFSREQLKQYRQIVRPGINTAES
jgi:hypothetical protein